MRLAIRLGARLHLCTTGLLVATLAGSPSATAEPAHEPYALVQPRIEERPARDHRSAMEPDEAQRWGRLQQASIEYAAMIIETYPGRELFFKMRNVEPVYYLTRLITAQTEDLARVHRVNLSQSGSCNSAHQRAYLEHKGVHQRALDAGKRLLLVDGSALYGTTFGAFGAGLSADPTRIQTHVIASTQETVPSSRVTARAILGDDHAEGAVTNLPSRENNHETMAHWEVGAIPHYCATSTHYAQLDDGRWVAMAPTDQRPGDWYGGDDIAATRQRALRFLEDLKHTFAQPATQQLLQQRRALWRQTRRLISAGDLPGLASLIEQQYACAPSGRFAEAYARDVADLVRLGRHRARVRLSAADLRGAESKRELITRSLRAH
jgi:hypothetical protein